MFCFLGGGKGGGGGWGVGLFMVGLDRQASICSKSKIKHELHLLIVNSNYIETTPTVLKCFFKHIWLVETLYRSQNHIFH